MDALLYTDNIPHPSKPVRLYVDNLLQYIRNVAGDSGLEEVDRSLVTRTFKLQLL